MIGPSRTPGMGSYFANLNRNKRSVALDLKQPAAREALLRLVETADVFVHNMRIGAAQRLGLDYETLAARNPRLIYACASGFRKGSSMQEFPAYDDLIQGVSGIAVAECRSGRRAALLPNRRGGQADRGDSGLDDRHGAVPPRTHRRGAGNPPADDGDDPVLHPGGASVARHPGRAGERPRLSADADAASPSVSDQGRLSSASSRTATRNGANCSRRWACPN